MIQPIKKRATHRAKIINGQLSSLLKKIEDEAYCVDVLTQSLAIQKSLGSLNKLILENHLQTCAKDKLSSRDEVQAAEAIQELLHLYELGIVRAK